MDDIIIRKATAGDATGIAIVRAYTWATAYHGLMPDSVLAGRIDAVPQNAGRMKSFIEKGLFEYIVATHNNAVIGFAGYGKSRNPEYPDDGEISALYVLKGFAGMGTGRKIFEFAARQLKKDGYTNMIINCLCGNPSINFYRHMGGQIVGSREDEIFGGHKIKEDIIRFNL
ncbi:MAG: GNAT family N-acetyltransferase [Oscillospiraceae bacterium]|nr:GNAT family N-acetyltransferase [Oscillospiraceae bacterium]